MGTGRPNKGPAHVDNLDASRRDKLRLRVILETMSGEKSVDDACKELGIKHARFAELRKLALEGAALSISAKSAGRPRKEKSAEQRRIEELEARVAELEQEAALAQVSEAIRIALASSKLSDSGKKTKRRQQ